MNLYTPRRAAKAIGGRTMLPMLAVTFLLSGCGTALVPSGGPTASQIESRSVRDAGMRIQDIDAATTQRIVELSRPKLFSDALPGASAVRETVSRGDQLEISLWEAPPGFLFSAASLTGGSFQGSAAPSSVTLPAQMVGEDGKVSVPFAGAVPAAGLTPSLIAADIRRRLVAKAHQPQAIVRIVRNINQTATIVGEVGNPSSVQLTPKGERLLDAIALAGGIRQPPSRTTVQVTRGGVTYALPMDTIISDPNQNIVLSPRDIVTVLYQPFSFTSLGATGKNEEVNFEGTGVTLSQALGRVGGLKDDRANVKGVFVFRYEDPAVSGPYGHIPQGEPIPTIYRVDLRQPQNFFLAQKFPIKNKDIIYISNAPISDIQKVVGALSSIVLPAITTNALLRNN